MNDEQERLKRLRERQLADRDPLVKQKQFQREASHKERRARTKKYTFGEAWRTIPNVYRSPLIGFLLGVGVIILLPYFWTSPWAFWVGVGIMVILIIFGVVVGQALDLRENLKDSIKH